MANPELIKHTHSGVVIFYNENRNTWDFVLRGRDRSSESLTLAREAIDKPVPKTTKEFEKIQAWEFRYGYSPSKVEVTGIGDKTYEGEWNVWIKDSGGRRRKENPSYTIYPANANNDALAELIIGKHKEIKRITSEIADLSKKLSPLKVEAPE